MIIRKTDGELDLMEDANRIVHEVLDGIGERVRPGATTADRAGDTGASRSSTRAPGENRIAAHPIRGEHLPAADAAA